MRREERSSTVACNRRQTARSAEMKCRNQLASNAHDVGRVALTLCKSAEWSGCVVFLMKSPFSLRRGGSVPIELLHVLPKAMVNGGAGFFLTIADFRLII
jgi:hypothetical protein